MLNGVKLYIPLGQRRGTGSVTDIVNFRLYLWITLQINAAKTYPRICRSWKDPRGHLVAAVKTRSTELYGFTKCLLLMHVFHLTIQKYLRQATFGLTNLDM
jgi:hypothetical protein